MTDTTKQVADNLEAAGVETRIWDTGAGRLLISAHGARILRCEVEGAEGNLFWHSQGLLDREKTAQHVKQRKAMLGGDRLWIAPENAYHFTDLQKARIAPFEHYTVPGDVDPGNWDAAFDEGKAEFKGVADLRDFRNAKRIRIDMTRRFELVDHQGDATDAASPKIAFMIEHELEVIEGDDEAVAGAWNILQVPAGGVLICPTKAEVNAPRSYYDDYDAHHVIEKDGAVRFKLDGRKRIKIGLRPDQTNGFMGYYRNVGGVHTLIVRRFSPADAPGVPYIDLPRSTDDIFGGDALQSYNDNSGPHSFGEMEYHDPAVVVGETDAHTGWAHTLVFTGSEEKIRADCETWLGVKLKD